ncbi:Oidioi.mRNA.OKI2018_I69.chr2.g6993.t2.cds [Oikopleura dioica]|uniref:Oidioi.mRNA.OKI2018_I69.chr2.g6993.t2.cds n=1 Tax=Oikopleura dioica TaxID=34765 RepID=A0ABN7TBI4_OIKDI|nr:Oidioi.mRNA.OKI2018_I69.chr2.g6993.t2.cds [Oikopleura dioica]
MAFGRVLFAAIFSLLAIIPIGLLYRIYTQEITFENSSVEDSRPFPNDENKNLLHFVQISDIHVSKFHDPERIAEFKIFSEKTLSSIKPEVVLISGDLTDAKTANKYGSYQYTEEWEAYSAIVDKIQFPVVDLRGNHDAFDVLTYEKSSYQIFTKDRAFKQNREITLSKEFGNYTIVGINAAPEPGMRRPYNFIGYISEEQRINLQEIGERTRTSNHSIWFGHYPTPTLHRSYYYRDFIGTYATAYLSGHLHDSVPRMQKLHSSGLAELELADWKKNRVFRILSFDHDLLSWTDMKWSKDGVYLHITNLPVWQLTNPDRQPVGRIAKSTHIRVLIYGGENLAPTMTYLGETTSLSRVDNSDLWVAPWKPAEAGEVEISVDYNGQTYSITRDFIPNYTSIRPHRYSALGNFLLTVDFCVYFTFFFWVGTLLSIGIMFSMSPLIRKFVRRQPLVLRWRFLLRIQILLGKEPFCVHLSYPLLAWLIWFAFLPWSLGYVIGDEIGVIFSFGIFYRGEMHTRHEMYAEGFWSMISFVIPYLFYTSYFAERKWAEKTVNPFKSVFNLLFFLLIPITFGLRVFSLYQIVWSYGNLAGCSPIFGLPPFIILYSSYYIFFKQSTPAPNN